MDNDLYSTKTNKVKVWKIEKMGTCQASTS